MVIKMSETMEKRINMAALRFEELLRHLLTIEPKNLPAGWMKINEPRGADEGLAEADIWRLAFSNKKLTEIDLGFLRMIELLTAKVNELELRIKDLERE